MTTITISSERIQNIATLAQTDTDTVLEWINNDWDNQSEHEQWLAEATDAEIAEWIQAGLS